MTRSRIFEEYARIADERGLVTPRVKNAKDDNPRGPDPDVDMSYGKKRTTRQTYKPKVMSTTEIFYGVQPNGEEKHIMEQAHSEPVIIAPSYDKINGLVENNIERQKIIINQVLRPNDGNVNHRKLAAKAHQELVFELVRIANDLDIRGEDELRALADNCIEKMCDVDVQLKSEAGFWDDVKSFFSEDAGDLAIAGGTGAAAGGVAGAIIGGILGAVATAPVGEAAGLGPLAGALVGAKAGAWIGGISAGLLSAVAGTSPKAKSVSINSASTIQRIDKLPEAKTHPVLIKLRAEVEKLHTLADFYAGVSSGQTTSVNEERIKKITSDYIHQMATVKTEIGNYKRQAETGAFEDKSEGDMWSKIKTPIYNLINNKVTDVTKELNSLIRTIDVSNESMKEVHKHAEDSKIEQAQADKLTSEINTPAAAAKPTAKPTAPSSPVQQSAPPSGVAAPQAEESLFGLD